MTTHSPSQWCKESTRVPPSRLGMGRNVGQQWWPTQCTLALWCLRSTWSMKRFAHWESGTSPPKDFPPQNMFPPPPKQKRKEMNVMLMNTVGGWLRKQKLQKNLGFSLNCHQIYTITAFTFPWRACSKTIWMGLTNGQQPVLLPQERRLLRREPVWGSYACNRITATSLGTVTDLDYGLGLLFSM